MRMLIVALALVGCDEHGKSPLHADGATSDVNQQSCTAPLGTANIQLLTQGGATVFRRLDAGGVWQTGPVNGANGAPMTITLLFTNTDPLDSDQAHCCAAADTSCCGSDGLVVQTDSIPDGAEVGAHTATFRSVRSATGTVSGTLTISQFQHPFEAAPGRIAGSVSAVSNDITGSFDNSFCQILLSATI